MPYEKDPDELGALWEKAGKKGTYMTGTIEGVGAVVLFKNGNKRNDKSPDWRVLKSKPRERGEENRNEVGIPERWKEDEGVPF